MSRKSAFNLIKSMRLRTLPLSLGGVLCGGILALGQHGGSGWVLAFTCLTACALQVLSNLSNEMGDYCNGVDGADRQGPAYGMANGLTEKELWRAINGMVVVCCASGLLMLLFSFQFCIFNIPFFALLLLGAAAIWAATHYTLGKKPYGYVGLGDLFVFIFFGLVSVLGSYYVMAHTIDFSILLMAPAVGMGLLSVAVLNVNNIRDMDTDRGIRKTTPLRLGMRGAKIYHTLLVATGVACFAWNGQHFGLCVLPTLPFFLWHIIGVWRRQGRQLDKMLPLLVVTTFVLAVLYAEVFHVTHTSPYPIW